MPKNFEKNFKEEIWGCFKYIGIPFETIMKMPVMDRKFYITMHNREGAGDSDDNTRISDEEINNIAKMEMQNKFKY